MNIRRKELHSGSDTIVEARDLCLEYPILGYNGHSAKAALLNAATGGAFLKGTGSIHVSALRNLSFSIAAGDRIGLIGHNGAGKSSLLKVLAQVYTPTSGSLWMAGRVVSALGLMSGVDPEATGYENILARGLLLGMSRSEIEQKIDDITEFSELGDYLRLPVRIYSSGMSMRLSFAILTAFKAEIVIMDEVIGTGDANFMRKAQRRLEEFLDHAKVFVLASHDAEVLRRFCNSAFLLKAGSLVGQGSIDEMLDLYARTSNPVPENV